MAELVERSGLGIAAPLASFIEEQVLPGLSLETDRFWRGFARIFAQFTPDNRLLIERRGELQDRIDSWCKADPERARDPAEQERFLREIGYLAEQPAPFTIGTSDVDPEIAERAGPQLVVPVLNARFVLNAANARWGSLYDALYGSDVLGEPPAGGGYDPERGARVIARAKAFLDGAVPLEGCSWANYSGGEPSLRDRSQLVGHRGDSLLLRNNGLHIELVVDPDHPIGRGDSAAIADVLLESALTTIVDFEDSIAAVDVDDKVAAYANWLGLMRGTLEESFDKSGKTVSRRLSPDRRYRTGDGSELTLPGRSLLFVRNVGHLMTTQAVMLPDGEAPEGVLDAIITSLIALYDLKGFGRYRNSATGSIYIVKPKMHGPDECAFTDRLFGAVEDLLDLPRNTVKVGLMDEERRTSANLPACIHALRNRIVFINTGFLDRTGDEIRTSTFAGPMVPKGEMKSSAWIKAYEDRNVRIGLACGLSRKAQIGKGMWAAPDRMAEMVEQKIAHPQSGANTAWVPSPTAATLHALHYHEVDVFERQKAIAAEPVPPLTDLLAIPVAVGRNWSREEVARELDNNVQSILGYVVRWVEQGIGCSKVPDINDIGLMEDRATLRISSQHIANWLLHGVVSVEQVDEALERMAAKVDAQNQGDRAYRPMTGREDSSPAFRAARALIFDGIGQPSGYTEPLLHRFRLEAKAGA